MENVIIEQLKQQLETLKKCAEFASMSNDRYYTDGSKKQDDYEISQLEKKIKEIENID